MFNDEELNRFYRYCVALTGNEQDAFDLLQDCLEQFIRRGAGGIENRQGYFFTMIHSNIPRGTLLSRIHRFRSRILRTLENGRGRVQRS
jgi:DNA-directed RNA polymerase specialized sigma24 family protein